MSQTVNACLLVGYILGFFHFFCFEHFSTRGFSSVSLPILYFFVDGSATSCSCLHVRVRVHAFAIM